MIKKIYNQLPGPTPLRVTVIIIGIVVALVLLVLFYEWLGSTFLDSGGTVG